MATRSRAWCRHTRRSTAAAPVTPALRGRAQESKVRHALELLYYIREPVYDMFTLEKEKHIEFRMVETLFSPKIGVVYFGLFFFLN